MISRDEFGPEYVIEVYDPRYSMRGFVVIDNTALGPGKGGVRMTSNVTQEEVFRLARTMTWKNALSGIPFGGAKAGIVWPPAPIRGAETPRKETRAEKKQIIQSFARRIKPLVPRLYITGPDVNTGEQDMQWFVEATGNWKSATGKPANLCMKVFGKRGERCGIPHEFGSTGFGVAHSTAVAAHTSGMPLKNATVAIHGFGNVGTFTYQYLTSMGARVIAIADREGAVLSLNGFTPRILERLIKAKKSIREYPGGRKLSADGFWSVPVDILIPASVTDVINEKNKARIAARLIVEAANIPMRESIEREFHNRGIVIVPDFVANAGGVISSYAEYRGYNPKKMFELVERKISYTTKRVIQESITRKKNPRDVALEIAKNIVRAKMQEQKNKK